MSRLILHVSHDMLMITGGSIGFGLPVAVGAAIACPDRKVLALEGDGSAMYTLQSLWTMARENLDVTVVVFANRRYQNPPDRAGKCRSDARGTQRRANVRSSGTDSGLGRAGAWAWGRGCTRP